MRYALILALLFLAACRGSSNNTIQPTTPTGDPIYTDPTNWAAIQLNTAYTIKFPAGYEGVGAVGFEGLSFGKNRVDKRATFSYSFCGPLLCNEYGDPLFGKEATSVTYKGQTLAKSVTLTQGSTTRGIFYYSETAKANGVLYLLDGFQLKESLNVQFDNEVQAEVIAIIKTIQPKL
jgi:hypothetical protein